jgi:hypothetical protein
VQVENVCCQFLAKRAVMWPGVCLLCGARAFERVLHEGQVAASPPLDGLSTAF